MNMSEPTQFNTEVLRGELLHDEPMSRHVSWRAGGVAQRVYQPADLADLQVFLQQIPVDEPLLAVGLGSNLLVRDGGLRGTVLLLHGDSHAWLHDRPVPEAPNLTRVMVPGDGENDAGEILKHLPRMEQADVVVPFVVNPEVRSLKRRLLSLLYGRIINLSFGLSLRYLNGTVMYRTELLHGLELRSSGFFYQAELLIKTIRQGARYVEVPCRLQQRRAGQSKAVTWSSFGHVMRAYLAIFSEVYLAR